MYDERQFLLELITMALWLMDSNLQPSGCMAVCLTPRLPSAPVLFKQSVLWTWPSHGARSGCLFTASVRWGPGEFCLWDAGEERRWMAKGLKTHLTGMAKNVSYLSSDGSWFSIPLPTHSAPVTAQPPLHYLWISKRSIDSGLEFFPPRFLVQTESFIPADAERRQVPIWMKTAKAEMA